MPHAPDTDVITLVASGDQRTSANRACWPAQKEMEGRLAEAVQSFGYRLERAHPYDPDLEHGFIDSQDHGREVFRTVDPERPLIVACAAWQYSHHVLHGLLAHRGPILTCANWSGQWPGLVGMLNLNGCLTKAGVTYSTLWSRTFTDERFRDGLKRWLETGRLEHDTSHVRAARHLSLPDEEADRGRALAEELYEEKAILGVFDEGCMGMYNAIVPDELLHERGVFKERLSQSALYYETTRVEDAEAERCLRWLEERGMSFAFGEDPEEELTREQVLGQLKMYVAALRIADDFGCDAIGIQYQQGLQDLLPASDLAEGLINNTERPPVFGRDGERELYAGEAVPHFNEVDECAGLDALLTHRVWNDLGYDPETTLHDVRWGEEYEGQFVWVFEISGSAPANHFADGYASAMSERQPPMYFRSGGGTLKGVSKPGEIVWSRIFVENGTLKADIGRGGVLELPEEETERRLQATTPQWPIMHAVTYGVSRDQMMARHKANHVQVAYAPSAEDANRALAAKTAAFEAMGIEVFVCGSETGL